MTKIIPILGNTSSGKSFLGKNLENTHKLPYLSFGDIKRKEIIKNTILGLRLQSDINNNLPINPNDGIELIQKNILKRMSIILLSGYPISLEEYVPLNSVYQVILGIYLRIDKITMRKRFFSRAVCPFCDFPGTIGDVCIAHNLKMVKREDATEKEFNRRIRLFNNRIVPFISLITKKSLFELKVYGPRLSDFEEISTDIINHITNLETKVTFL